jgi:hypothetical protein
MGAVTIPETSSEAKNSETGTTHFKFLTVSANIINTVFILKFQNKMVTKADKQLCFIFLRHGYL